MSEGVAAIGVNGKILLAQIINFLILFIVLWLFAFRPIVKLLDERKARIAKAQTDADAIERQKQETEAKTKAILAEAQAQAKKIVDEAVKLASDQKDKIISSANQESEAIQAQTQKQLEAEKEKALHQAKKRLAEIVMIATQKLIKVSVDEKTARKLSAEAIREVE